MARVYAERPSTRLSRAHVAPAPFQGTPGPMGCHPTRARRARPRTRRRDTDLTSVYAPKTMLVSGRRCPGTGRAQAGCTKPDGRRRIRCAAWDTPDASDLSHGTPRAAAAFALCDAPTPRLWARFHISSDFPKMTPGRGWSQGPWRQNTSANPRKRAPRAHALPGKLGGGAVEPAAAARNWACRTSAPCQRKARDS